MILILELAREKPVDERNKLMNTRTAPITITEKMKADLQRIACYHGLSMASTIRMLIARAARELDSQA